VTFIDTVIDKTNIDIVVSDTKGDQEARDDPRVGLGSVQKREHAVAGIVGSDNKTPSSPPRDKFLILNSIQLYAWHGTPGYCEGAGQGGY